MRSNPKRSVGFLSEPRRMNVGVTRGRRHVCLVGDSETSAAHPFLRRLLDYALPTTDDLRLTPYYSLLTTHYSLLTTHCFLLPTPYSLLPTSYFLRTVCFDRPPHYLPRVACRLLDYFTEHGEVRSAAEYGEAPAVGRAPPAQPPPAAATGRDVAERARAREAALEAKLRARLVAFAASP